MRMGEWVFMEKYVIGDPADPYLIRWRIFECPWFRIYFHRILKSDRDRHLHDHPYNFVSLIIKGAYWEQSIHPNPPDPTITGVLKRYGRFSFNPKHCMEPHRISLEYDNNGKEIPAWTLMFAGRRIRSHWCFHTERGLIHFDRYLEVGGDLSKLPEERLSVIESPKCYISCISADTGGIEQIEDEAWE